MEHKIRYVSAGQAAQALGISREEVVASIERNGFADLIGGKVGGEWWLPAAEVERKRSVPVFVRPQPPDGDAAGR